MNTYLKWGLIVVFNTILSIAWAEDFLKTVSGVLGVIVGIIIFIMLYATLDRYLKKTNKKEWRKSLLVAAIMMGFFSLYPAIPLVSGAIALDMTSWIFNLTSNSIKTFGFFPIPITTLFSGMILSGVVIIFTGVTRVFLYQRTKFAKTVSINNG